ncbi:MAG: DUF512 domain-containing protein [Ruminococcaceae bacterium]|nr:DUF512 domain-containing protein [Oscillospiraceae bacterium]
MVKICAVEEGSLAAKKRILAGDILLAINGHEISDVLDYRFYLTERRIALLLSREGKEYKVKIKKGEYDDIGLSFFSPLMDGKHTCRNKCIFCFIDQMPKGYRDTLYFKDDDSRLSFLQGSYVTLTNMTDADIDRIIKMRLSPIRVSVHTTNPELRVKMMKNPRAGEVLSYLPRLAEAGITISAQIVLCRGVNDGEELLRSMHDLAALYPALDSVSVVPAGLTRFREGLYPLSPFTPEECLAVVRTVEDFSAKCQAAYGAYLFHASDEFYLKAGLPLPSEEHYEGYLQLENGVGMLTSFENEFLDALADAPKPAAPRRVTVATGHAAYPLLSRLAAILAEKEPSLTVSVEDVENEFFGPEITVAGLLTGEDYLKALVGKSLGDALLISRTSLRAEGDLFLCGMSKEELADKLGTPVVAVENDGALFLNALLGV